MWLENLKELKKKSGMSSKQIADATKIPESTVKRIFSGDTENPLMDTLRRIVDVLGGSLDDLFAESTVRVSNANLTSLQAEYDKLAAETSSLRADNVSLRHKLELFEAEIEHLRATLAHKEEIVSLQDEIIRLHKTYTPPSPDKGYWKL